LPMRAGFSRRAISDSYQEDLWNPHGQKLLQQTWFSVLLSLTTPG
jgi:hypothetical protein